MSGQAKPQPGPSRGVNLGNASAQSNSGPQGQGQHGPEETRNGYTYIKNSEQNFGKIVYTCARPGCRATLTYEDVNSTSPVISIRPHQEFHNSELCQAFSSKYLADQVASLSSELEKNMAFVTRADVDKRILVLIAITGANDDELVFEFSSAQLRNSFCETKLPHGELGMKITRKFRQTGKCNCIVFVTNDGKEGMVGGISEQ